MHTILKASVAFMCLVCASTALGQTVNFTLGTTNGTEDLSTRAMDRWRVAMEEQSGGELVMEISSGGALGGDQELLQQLATNEIQAHIAGPVVLHRLVPKYQCLEAEYVMDNQEHGFRVWRGPLGEEVSEALKAEFGIEIIEPDVAAFSAIATPIVEAFAAENCREGLLADIRAAAD
jgi:TRAP-type C4-dicarboxylate transport system substrate-binding protein